MCEASGCSRTSAQLVELICENLFAVTYDHSIGGWVYKRNGLYWKVFIVLTSLYLLDLTIIGKMTSTGHHCFLLTHYIRGTVSYGLVGDMSCVAHTISVAAAVVTAMWFGEASIAAEHCLLIHNASVAIIQLIYCRSEFKPPAWTYKLYCITYAMPPITFLVRLQSLPWHIGVVGAFAVLHTFYVWLRVFNAHVLRPIGLDFNLKQAAGPSWVGQAVRQKETKLANRPSNMLMTCKTPVRVINAADATKSETFSARLRQHRQ